jgi:hypothetical protein
MSEKQSSAKFAEPHDCEQSPGCHLRSRSTGAPTLVPHRA